MERRLNYPFADDMIICMEHTQDFTTNQIRQAQQGSRTQNQHTKLAVLWYTNSKLSAEKSREQAHWQQKLKNASNQGGERALQGKLWNIREIEEGTNG